MAELCPFFNSAFNATCYLLMCQNVAELVANRVDPDHISHVASDLSLH